MITLLDERWRAGGEAPVDDVVVEGDAYRHLCRARRAEVGEAVRLTDGRGDAVRARIEAIDRRRVLLRVVAAAPSSQPRHRVELWIGTLRLPRASWLVEKATELGVGGLRFFRSEHAVRGYGEAALDRLRRVARSALEQSHGSWLPAISGVHEWAETLAAGPGVFLDLNASVTWFTAPVAPGVILVGPEGGWSDDECRELAASGHRPIGLGGQTLRVETAALASLAIVQHEVAVRQGQ